VYRPERLFDSTQYDLIARLLAWMICGKAPVIRRVPILRTDHQVKRCLYRICNRNHRFAVRNWQRAAFDKIVLQVNEN
jgi:hypothetical protein